MLKKRYQKGGKNMFNLLRKDYYIAKKMWIAIMIMAVVIPIFISFIGSDLIVPSSVVLPIITILLSQMLLNAIVDEEEKYPKAKALITSMGYSRNQQVIKSFILMIVIFVYCTIIYSIEAVIIKNIEVLSFADVAISALIFVFVTSLHLTMVIKYGNRAGKYISMMIILIISLGPSIFSKFKIDINLSLHLSDTQTIIMSLIGVAIVYIVSIRTSMIAYSNKEL